MGRVRYFMSGEYGEQNNRPHYHACIFGIDFIQQDPGAHIWKVKQLNGKRILLWRSPLLESIWSERKQDGSSSSLGFSSVGAVTFESAAYVARYIMKKVTGDQAADHYGSRRPEYSVPSKGGRDGPGGIGRTWFLKYGVQELWPDDLVVVGNRKVKVPAYYDRLLEQVDPALFAEVKQKRLKYSQTQSEERTPERLAVRKQVFQSRISRLKRGLDDH